jgi:TRAP-type mannitol/chloroaromatic compound transport system permease large subunit
MKVVREALDATTRLSSFVMFIVIGSSVFALVFRAVNGDLWVERLFTLVPGGEVGFLIVVHLMIFVLGFFIDFFEIAFILLPLLAPVAAKLGIDPVWFAVMIGINLQTSFLTPPFGFSLFYLRSVAPPQIKTADIYRGIIPFVIVQLIALLLVVFYPQLVTVFNDAKPARDSSNIEINIPVDNTADKPDADGLTREEKSASDIERMLRDGK